MQQHPAIDRRDRSSQESIRAEMSFILSIRFDILVGLSADSS